MWFVRRLLWCALAGALIALIFVGGYRLWALLGTGQSPVAMDPVLLALDRLRLHLLAAWGAVAGIAFGVLERLWRMARIRITAMLHPPAPAPQRSDADAILSAERKARANRYLSTLERRRLDFAVVTPDGAGEGPKVENVITARNGTFTYRVLAYRHLSENERMQVVADGLELGLVEEPEPGGTTTVMTSIGKDDEATHD